MWEVRDLCFFAILTISTDGCCNGKIKCVNFCCTTVDTDLSELLAVVTYWL